MMEQVLPRGARVATTETAATTKPPEFSLALGGPLFELYRGAHLSGDALEFPLRRALAITLFAWLPLAILSLVDGHAFGGPVKVPFLYDLEAHARILIALPMLVIAEIVVHRRLSPVIRHFVNRRIVATEDLPKLTAAINEARRARNSVWLELFLLVLVYTLGLWVFRNKIELGFATWYAMPESTHMNLTPAGYWYTYISVPIVQFMLFRWYARIVVWARLLWRISKLNLHLSAAHPDRTGGLGFLGATPYAFVPLLVAQGSLLSGLIASRVLFAGQDLLSFKTEAGGLIGVMLLFVVGPLVMFYPQLLRAKRKGAAQYALLANRYVFGFEKKWIESGTPNTDQLLGTADLQSLADLGDSYSVVAQMRTLPFKITDMIHLAVVTAAPLLPLILTAFSAEEVLSRLAKLLL
jgi:hypothetical protein